MLVTCTIALFIILTTIITLALCKAAGKDIRE